MPFGLDIDQDLLANLCRRHHISKLELFGSRAKGTARPDSDVDLLVTFEAGKTPGLEFFGLPDEFAAIFHRPVDLFTRASVEQSPNPYKRHSILSSAQPIYATPAEPADRGLLRDMLAYGQRAIRHLGGLSAVTNLRQTRRPRTVLVRWLAIVGEAAWKMSDSLKRAHPAVPWTLIAGMRHRLVHDYGAVDLRTVHRVATEHLPALLEQVRAILAADTTPS